MFFVISLLIPAGHSARQGRITVGFYNLENLFDTINEPGKSDGEFTPQGSRKWDTRKYNGKLDALAGAISLFAPDILGVCEAENIGVLDDMAVREAIAAYGYAAVHYDSPDPRGADVALLYRADRVEILSSEPLPAPEGKATRDILRVEAFYEGLAFSIYVVHLPSRRGNDPAAARQRRRMVETLDKLCLAETQADPERCVVVCGDFNDNPDSRLLRGSMGTMRNASAAPFRQGKGSYAWRDVWQMYDQIFVSLNMTSGQGLWRMDGDAEVVGDPALLQRSGRFAAYPAKGKISDHLPVVVKFVKK